MQPIINMPDYGRHNAALENTVKRLEKSGSFEDQSTVIILPGFDSVPMRCAFYWLNIVRPPNQKVFTITTENMEVGQAYTAAIEAILANPILSTCKYILTVEHDNAPPCDGLLRLYEAIEGRTNGTKYDVVSGLYFTKGEGGVAQIWGDPRSAENNYRPQLPVNDSIVECCGTGMGFTLFRLDIFKDSKLRRPWFRTPWDKEPEGMKCMTQDLYFAEDARKYGYRFAVDCRVRVGHWDSVGRIMW